MIKERLIEAGAVKSGKFTKASGGETTVYVDVKEALTRPEVLTEIAGEIAKNISASKIAGVELGAVPLVVAVSQALKIPYVIIRKEKKAYGVEKQFIGEIKKGESIEIIEDVVTKGKTVASAVELLRREGAEVSRAICVVDREEGGREALIAQGVGLISLVRLSELSAKS